MLQKTQHYLAICVIERIVTMSFPVRRTRAGHCNLTAAVWPHSMTGDQTEQEPLMLAVILRVRALAEIDPRHALA